MRNFKIQSFGQIQNTEVNFGNLTILIGPQASGKSIFLQSLKLIIDKDFIIKTLRQYDYVFGKTPKNLLEYYFGEGMANIWRAKTKIILDNDIYDKNYLLDYYDDTRESLYYIPSQRILSISEGSPKNFMEFDISTPYVLRQFSELLRLYMEKGIKQEPLFFPVTRQLKTQIRQSFSDSIFRGGKIVMDERTGQKKIRMEVSNSNIPFMTWSAGQKEFMPLMIAFYSLSNPRLKINAKEKYKYVVIEEPEMGLHPKAILSVILQIIDLTARDYKVIITTHSPVFLEFAWAFNLLKSIKCDNSVLLKLLGLKKSIASEKFCNNLINKTINIFYFYRKNGRILSKDITSLDAGSKDIDIAEWGGLSSFAYKASDIVSKYF